MGQLRSLRSKSLAATLIVVAFVAMSAVPASAHTPHDVISDVSLSPSFATDHTVFAVSDNRPLRSTDGGAHWTEMVRGLAGQTLATFAFAPSDPDVVYLSSRGGGVYRSADMGATWSHTTVLATMRYVAQLAVSPTSPKVVVAAAGLFGGLFRTTDGGRTWSQVKGIGKVNTVNWVPSHPGRVVIGDADGTIGVSDDNGATYRAAPGPGGASAITATAVGSGGAGSALFAGTSAGRILASTDGGSSWTNVGAGVPDREEVTSLVLSTGYDSDSTLWASTFNEGVYRSTDRGKTWAPQFAGLTSDAQAHLYKLPEFQKLETTGGGGGGQTLYLAGYDGLFTSSNDGEHWTSVETVSEYVTGLAVSPDFDRDGTVDVNTYVKGVYISRDRGDSFEESDVGLGHVIDEGNKLLPVRRMHDVVFSPAFATDHTIFTATWDRFVKSTDGGRTWKSIAVSAPPPGSGNLRQFVIAVSPGFTSDHTIYLGTRQGDVYRSTRGGDAGTWTTIAKLDSGVRSIAISPAFDTDRTLFASTSNGIVTSADDGTTWRKTGPPGISLLSISPAYPTDHTLFAGTQHGLYATRDSGRTWLISASGPLSDTSNVAALAVSPDFVHDGTVLVSINGEGLFRSTDRGRTFTPVGASLLEHGLVIGDFENPTSEPIQFSRTFAKDRTIFAYAQQSVVRSTDGGDTWTVLDIPSAGTFVAPRSAGAPAKTATTSGKHNGAPVVPIAIACVLVVAVGALLFVRKIRHDRSTRRGSPTDAPTPSSSS